MIAKSSRSESESEVDSNEVNGDALKQKTN